PVDPAAGAGAEPKPAEPKPAEIAAEKVARKKAENSLSPKAAEYQGRIEAAISERRLSGHVKVQAAGNTLTLAGRLRPAEHGALLKLLRNAPSDVRVIDHLEYDDTPVAAGYPDEGSHPVPAEGRGAIHVVTDVIGATAVLRGPAGHILNKCETPCSFNNLSPSRYSLEVQKGAEIIVDGTSTGKFTPARVQVPSGVHTITLQLNGFQLAKRTFQVSEGGTVPIDEALHQK